MIFVLLYFLIAAALGYGIGRLLQRRGWWVYYVGGALGILMVAWGRFSCAGECTIEEPAFTLSGVSLAIGWAVGAAAGRHRRAA